MAYYKYTARHTTKGKVTGIIEAQTKAAAVTQVEMTGAIPISIEECAPPSVSVVQETPKNKKCSHAAPRRKLARRPFAIIVCLAATGGIVWFMVQLFGGASHPSTQRQPKPPPPREYITKTYYDLRDEEKGLYRQSGLSSEDTQVKQETVKRAMQANFRREYLGKYVKWTGGYVSDVEEESDRFICKVEMDQDAIFSTVDIQFPVSRHEAIDLKRYKEVLIDGKIKNLEGSLKVELEDVELSYTGRSLNDMCEERKSQNKSPEATR